jgi:hypothetical protein
MGNLPGPWSIIRLSKAFPSRQSCPDFCALSSSLSFDVPNVECQQSNFFFFLFGSERGRERGPGLAFDDPHTIILCRTHFFSQSMPTRLFRNPAADADYMPASAEQMRESSQSFSLMIFGLNKDLRKGKKNVSTAALDSW